MFIPFFSAKYKVYFMLYDILKKPDEWSIPKLFFFVSKETELN